MATKKRYIISNLFENKKFLVAFSIITALIMWLVIVIDQNPVRSKSFNNLPISINIDDSVAGTMGLDVISQNYVKNASVTVNGPNYLVSSLKSDDITVYADLSEVTEAGTYTLPLVPQKSNNSGYTIIDIVPSTIEVQFDYVDTKEFGLLVKADGIGVPAGLDLITGQPTVSLPSESVITVKGAKSQVDRIESAVAVLNKNEQITATKNYDDVKIYLYDSENNIINSNGLELSLEKVKITVPILKTAELKVLPMFSNEPYKGAGNALIRNMSVYYINVEGPPATIDQMENVQLSKINFSEISPSSASFDVSFVLPDGVKVVGNRNFVSVNLDLSNYTVAKFEIPKNNIKYLNLETGKMASCQGVSEVQLCGLRSDLIRIKPEDLFLEVDLSGKVSGITYTVSASVTHSTEKTFWAVGEYTTTVTIS